MDRALLRGNRRRLGVTNGGWGVTDAGWKVSDGGWGGKRRRLGG